MAYNPPRNPLEDPALQPYYGFLERRSRIFEEEKRRIDAQYGSVRAYADIYTNFGPHLVHTEHGEMWRWREYMPHALDVWLTTSKLDFKRVGSHRFKNIGDGVFELFLPREELPHGEYVELRVQGPEQTEPGSILPKSVPPMKREARLAQQLPRFVQR